MTRTIVAHFSRSNEAQAAVAALEQKGWTSRDVSYIAHDGAVPSADKLRGHVEPDSATTKGATAGAVSGVLLGLAALAIPGVGPVLAAGPLAAVLSGAGVGAATGGLLGALTDMGVGEKEGREVSERFGHGGTLVIVRSESENAEEARSILAASGATQVTSHESSATDDRNDIEPANVGDEGGSTQWTRKVLKSDRE